MGFNFGTPAPASNTPSLLNNTNTPASGGLFGSTPSSSLFGGTATTTTTAAPSLFGGTSSAASTSLFGNKPATSAATPSLFGNTLTATPKPSLFGSTSTSATSTPTLFGNTTTTTKANTTPSLFGGTQPATNSLFGNTTPSATANTPTLNLGATTTATPKEEPVTLGGIRSDIAKTSGPKAWRNESVPQPVCQIIDDFKKFLKEQKDLRDEVGRFSPSSIDKVKEETEFLIKKTRFLSHSIAKDSAAINSLKNSVIAELKNCEIAERTRESTSLPLEVSLPMEYFFKLVSQFEECIQQYKVQIDEIESVMHCGGGSGPESMASISSMLNRMHQIFVALAGKLHTLHEDVKLQKDFYLNYRKVIFKDETNVFETRRNAKTISQVCPTPFSDTTNSLTASIHHKGVSTSNAASIQQSYSQNTITLFNSTNNSLNTSLAAKPALTFKKLF